MSIDGKKQIETLDALTDALGRSEGQSTEEIKKELLEEGVDVEVTLDRLKMFQKNISMEAKRSVLDIAREKRLKLAKRGHKFAGRFKDWTEEAILARIKELSGPQFGVAYRDLKSNGIDDLRSILEDLEYTKTLDSEEDLSDE